MRTQGFRAAALDAAVATWRDRYAKGDAKDELPATIINICLKRLSRALVPLASTARSCSLWAPATFVNEQPLSRRAVGK